MEHGVDDLFPVIMSIPQHSGICKRFFVDL